MHMYIYTYICPPVIPYPRLLLQIMKGVMKLFSRRSCSRGSLNEVTSITSEDPGKENPKVNTNCKVTCSMWQEACALGKANWPV